MPRCISLSVLVIARAEPKRGALGDRGNELCLSWRGAQRRGHPSGNSAGLPRPPSRARNDKPYEFISRCARRAVAIQLDCFVATFLAMTVQMLTDAGIITVSCRRLLAGDSGGKNRPQAGYLQPKAKWPHSRPFRPPSVALFPRLPDPSHDPQLPPHPAKFPLALRRRGSVFLPAHFPFSTALITPPASSLLRPFP